MEAGPLAAGGGGARSMLPPARWPRRRGSRSGPGAPWRRLVGAKFGFGFGFGLGFGFGFGLGLG